MMSYDGQNFRVNGSQSVIAPVVLKYGVLFRIFISVTITNPTPTNTTSYGFIDGLSFYLS